MSTKISRLGKSLFFIVSSSVSSAGARRGKIECGDGEYSAGKTPFATSPGQFVCVSTHHLKPFRAAAAAHDFPHRGMRTCAVPVEPNDGRMRGLDHEVLFRNLGACDIEDGRATLHAEIEGLPHIPYRVFGETAFECHPVALV